MLGYGGDMHSKSAILVSTGNQLKFEPKLIG